MSSLQINRWCCSKFPECNITIKIKCNGNWKEVMDTLCLISETADRRRLDEFIYPADRYCYLLKIYSGVFAYLFWMKRTRESIVIPPWPNYKRNQKEKLQMIQAMPSQMKISDISLIKIQSVDLNLNIYNYDFIGW